MCILMGYIVMLGLTLELSQHCWVIETELGRGDGAITGRAQERFQGVVSTMGRSTQEAIPVDISFIEMWQNTFFN